MCLIFLLGQQPLHQSPNLTIEGRQSLLGLGTVEVIDVPVDEGQLGRSLKNKPTWPNVFGCCTTSAFLFSLDV